MKATVKKMDKNHNIAGATGAVVESSNGFTTIEIAGTIWRIENARLKKN